MPYVYILISKKDRRYYVGSTTDLDLRLKMHNSGTVTSTRFYRPWQLFYSEQFDTLGEAVSRERKIKSWKKRTAIERLVNGISKFETNRGSSTD
ncbi:MAG: GIY-YIG nuclease family protein [Candidatus Sungbacteria bacterium]|uniref:GIY-YIG nuclease family protein n=1 Tax=Candidatus Sungiibacteriota bacterium TaxID=2750080 RepID=A0A9D6LT22_9BACT|nr:GIY-YIG nuclease family protein [Candidatus Sungbacteria bacterium]